MDFSIDAIFLVILSWAAVCASVTGAFYAATEGYGGSNWSYTIGCVLAGAFAWFFDYNPTLILGMLVFGVICFFHFLLYSTGIANSGYYVLGYFLSWCLCSFAGIFFKYCLFLSMFGVFEQVTPKDSPQLLYNRSDVFVDGERLSEPEPPEPPPYNGLPGEGKIKWE